MRIALLFLLIFVGQTQSVPANTLSFEQLKMLYERKVAAIMKESEESREKLIVGYDRQLQDLLQTFTKSGELDPALAVKRERERLKSGLLEWTPKERGEAPVRLARLRGTFDRGLETLAAQTSRDKQDAGEKYVALLGDKIDELTRAGNLEEAVKVREEKVAIVAGLETKDETRAAGDLVENLIGTRWSWEDADQDTSGYTITFEKKGAVDFSWKKKVGQWEILSEDSVRVSAPEWKVGMLLKFEDGLEGYVGRWEKNQKRQVRGRILK